MRVLFIWTIITHSQLFQYPHTKELHKFFCLKVLILTKKKKTQQSEGLFFTMLIGISRYFEGMGKYWTSFSRALVQSRKPICICWDIHVYMWSFFPMSYLGKKGKENSFRIITDNLNFELHSFSDLYCTIPQYNTKVYRES